MDIVTEQVPEYPVEKPPTTEQPQLQHENTRMDTLEEAQLNAAMSVSALDQPEEPETPKRRGRPPGSRNKPKIIEPIPEEPIVLNEPPEPEPKRIKLPRKPRAKAPAAPPPTPQAPVPQTPLQIAASMLEILRLEQSERQWRKSELYKSWVK